MDARPRFITFGLTNRCNSRCLKCTSWSAGDPGPELALDEWLEAVERLHGWLGPFELVLSGGEPTLKEGYLEILRAASARRIKPVLATNGLTLRGEAVRDLARSGVDTVVFSMDGPEAINDRIKGVPGATRRVWEAVDRLKAENPAIRLMVLTVLMKDNLPVLPDFVGALLADSRLSRVRFQAVVQPLGEPRDPHWTYHSPLWPTNRNDIDRAIDWLLEQRAATDRIDNPLSQLRLMRRYFIDPASLSGVPCGVGRDAFFVSARGEVFLCGQMKPIGHVLREDPAALWAGERAVATRGEIRACRRFCHQLVNCCYVEDPPAEGVALPI